MEKVVIIGANEFQNPLILKAKEKGYETHVFAWKNNDIGEQTADYFYPISIIDIDDILAKCKQLKPVAVISIASDLAVVTVNELADKLGLTGNNPKNSLICTNKYEMRKALQQAHIPVPQFISVGSSDTYDISHFKFPVIVKPTDRSGSRGITKIDKEDDIAEALEQAINYSFSKKAIIEEYIDGNEYSCESISFQGNHHILTVTKKFTTEAPHFIETGHMQPSDLESKILQRIQLLIPNALDALHIENGASHTEFKITPEGDVRIIEIGARMGGDCIGSDLVPLSTGFDYVGMVLDVALGKEPKLVKSEYNDHSFIRFIFNEQDLNKLQHIEKIAPQLVYRKEIDTEFNHEVIDSSGRYGFYIFKTNTEEEERIVMRVM